MSNCQNLQVGVCIRQTALPGHPFVIERITRPFSYRRNRNVPNHIKRCLDALNSLRAESPPRTAARTQSAVLPLSLRSRKRLDSLLFFKQRG